MERSDARRLVEASAWRVRLAESDQGEGPADEEFQRWLAEDERNEKAWRRVNGPWELFGEHATSPELISARCDALTRVHDTGRRRWGARAVAARPVALALAATMLLGIALAFSAWQSAQFDVYRTALGERRTVMLADGSTLSLDAQSEVRVRIGSAARELSLVHGQALFDVAPDATRPFSVAVGGRKVIATGTSFNVDMLESRLFVTLLQGRVVVVPDTEAAERGAGSSSDELSGGGASQKAGAGSIELNPGQQLVIRTGGASEIVNVDVDLATAWQSGRVVFEDETLANAVARLNHYSDRKLVITDRSTAQLRTSGVFKVGDTADFVATITAYFPVVAHTLPDGRIELHSR